MAIETTKGLPSFSEMYSAFKNRNGLGEAISGGLKSLADAKAAKSKSELEAANAEEAIAHADYYRTPKDQNVLVTSLTPAEQQRLGDQAAPNEQGQLVVPWKSVVALRGGEAATLKQENEITKQGFEAEKNKMLGERNQMIAERDARIAQLLLEKQELSRGAQAASADASVLSATEKNKPGFLAKTAGAAGSLVGKVSPTLGEIITPDSIEQARMRQESLKRQQERGGSQVPTPAEAGVVPPTADMIAQPGPQRIYTSRGSGKNKETARRISSDEEFNALPKGVWYVTDTNQPRQKGK